MSNNNDYLYDGFINEVKGSLNKGGGTGGIVDQTYNAQSENAQSGIAVSEALRNKADKNKILDYLNYEVVYNGVSITGCDTSISGPYIIPDIIEGYIVTTIYSRAFSGCTKLTSITIPDSVTSISAWLFSGCTKLTSITIPDSVTIIDQRAFSGCTNLTSITIPDSVTIIDKSAFSGCTKLTSITIPDSVTSIGSNTFSDCTNLTSVYYKGTPEQWSQITIDVGNDLLTNATIHYNQAPATKEDVNTKQDTLVSGSNIKTINNESILGKGNINITAAQSDWNQNNSGHPAYVQNRTHYSTDGVTITDNGSSEYISVPDGTGISYVFKKVSDDIPSIDGTTGTLTMTHNYIEEIASVDIKDMTIQDMYNCVIIGTSDKCDGEASFAIVYSDAGYDDDFGVHQTPSTGTYVGGGNVYTFSELSIPGTIVPLDPKYIPALPTLQIGNTTLTEEQLQKLLALI